LYQFKELRQLDKNLGYFAFQLDTLAILADVDSDELEDLTIDELNNLFNSVKWALQEPKKGFKSKLTIDEEDFIFKPFNKLTLFEFIDLEYFLSNDYITHISHILSVFYRRIDKDKWSNVEFEPYIFSPFERFTLFDDQIVTDVYGILTDYLKYRENFMQKYENLFNDNDQDDEEEDDINDFNTAEEYKDNLKQKEHGKKAKKWGWESLLFDLCEGDITKMEDVGSQSLIFVFNMLSMRKDMGYLETSKG
tara:strand:- start:672 stop:1421 length:750 start_codon:yes stop_codon:yes gene_type:complete